MKKVNIKKYIFKHKVRSTLFILQLSKQGGIPDGTKKHIRKIRNNVANIRFILLSEEVPKIKEKFDLVITDGVGSALVERIKKIVKFNRLLVIYKGQVFDTNYNNGYKSIEIPLRQKSDLNRVVELQRVRKKRAYGQLAGMKTAHYIGVGLVAAVLLLPSLVIGVSLGEYKPKQITSLTINNNRSDKVQFNTKYSALTYNTANGEYNQNMHFCMDSLYERVIGGQGTAESKEAVNRSFDGVKRILTEQTHDADDIIDSNENVKSYELTGSRIYTTQYNVEENKVNARIEKSDAFVEDVETFNKGLNEFNGKNNGDGLFDFIAFQEQDINSPRSYNTDQPQIVNDAIVKKDGSEYKWSDMYNTTFAANYSVPFVPIPINDMIGKVYSGLTIFSRYYASNAQRISLPSFDTFPYNLFEMKRCMSVNYYPIGNASSPDKQKYFLFINAHTTAIDDGGDIRREQLQKLNTWLKYLDDHDCYYIVAADWNQILPDTRGYEGNDIYRSELTDQYRNDQAIMGWDYEEMNEKHANLKNPNLEKDYIKPAEYDATKSYKAGDIVSYTLPGEEPEIYEDLDPIKDAPGHNGPLTQYMESTMTHNYEAMENINPGETPVNGDGTKSSKWRYSLSHNPIYKDASLSDYVRNWLLPITYNKQTKDITDVSRYYQANANFYTTHAIPTLRHAAAQFRNESRAAKGYCYKASIDGFLVSKNIRVYQTIGFDTNFKYSDHNPVGITFELVNK